MTLRLLLVVAFLIVLRVGCSAAPITGPRIGPDRKLIKWGMDTPDSEEWRTRPAEFESWPFDGYVISADARIDGKKAWLHGQMSSTHKFA